MRWAIFVNNKLKKIKYFYRNISLTIIIVFIEKHQVIKNKYEVKTGEIKRQS